MRPPAGRHAVTNAVVQIDGDKAKAWAYWNTFQNDNLSRSAEPGNYGSYEDELVKRDGRWLFTSRKIFNQMKPDRVAPRELPFAARIAAGPPPAATTSDDRAAIENLQARYMFALDWQDPEAYAATFAPDGVLVSAIAQAQGREAIHAEVVKMRDNDLKAAQPGLFAFSRRHVITNVVLEINGERATGRAYWIGYINDNPDRKPELEGYGHYEDELVKLDGEWLFARRTIFNELRPGHTASEQWPLAE
jgi:ketosteroid isomerase-like protein